MPLDDITHHGAQHARRQRIEFEAVTLKVMCVPVAVPLSRPGRKAMLLDLFLGERSTLDSGRPSPPHKTRWHSFSDNERLLDRIDVELQKILPWVKNLVKERDKQ